MNKLKLPKIYKNESGKYPQFEGFPKLSYSQYNSWINLDYRPDYIRRYFLGEPFETNVWADFGTDVGTFIEITGTNQDYSNFVPLVMTQDNDREILRNIEYPENSTYEDEIVLPVKDKDGEILFVIQGFIDRATYNGKSVSITDFKTGNLVTKKEYYASEGYGQTTLYSYCKDLEGFKIKQSNVLLLGRKGNGRSGHPIRLSGGVELIDTPYSRTRAKKLIKKMTNVAWEIDKYYKIFNKINI